MRYAVISDVHGNLEALKKVLSEIKSEAVDEVLFLGDAVGYGPEPNECIELLKKGCRIMLAGNHDWAALGLTDVSYFNSVALEAIQWTIDVLKDKNRKFLGTFPLLKRLDKLLLVHSTPKQPEQWHYLFTYRDAEVNFQLFEEWVCLIGHSHQPVIIERLPSGELITCKDEAYLRHDARYIINVGSVGQPRDGNPKAAYAVLDLDKTTISIKRVEYEISLTQEKMRKAGLPEYLIERLSYGR